jgi:superfamily II DNA or RNA helicase
MSLDESTALRTLDLIVHETDHEAHDDSEHIQETFRGLVEDRARTAAICDDIAAASGRGRNCLVLTRWTEHLDSITESLSARGLEPLRLHGQLGERARGAIMEKLDQISPEGGLILVATASLLGEGFDCPPLDTLFLAFPIKFKGSVVQYVGRILRPTEAKTRIEVHDYVDVRIPVLARMHDERRSAYASLGFDLPQRPRRRSSQRLAPARR